MFNKLRNFTFWRLDEIKGSKILKAYKDIEYFFKQDSNSIELKRHHENKINLLLTRAINNTVFYQKFKDYNNLSDFPVINKKTIKQQQNDFLSINYKKKNYLQCQPVALLEPHSLHIKMKKKRGELTQKPFILMDLQDIMLEIN